MHYSLLPRAAPRAAADSYLPGDPMAIAEAIENNTDSVWALWSQLAATEETGFADTVPVAAPEAT